MKFAIAGIFQKEFPDRMNYQQTLQVIRAESEDEAIGFFIKIGFDKFPDYTLFLRPVCAAIENETTEAVDHGAGEPCPNCKETQNPCACLRNKCRKCGKPVGNITFTCCDECFEESKNFQTGSRHA